MGRRIGLDVDSNDDIHEERWERDPPVMDEIKVGPSTVDRMENVADQLGVDGEELVDLLGGCKNADETTYERVYLSRDEQEALADMLSQLEDAIEDDVDLETIEQQRQEVGNQETEQIEAVGEYRYYAHRIHSKAEMIRDQTEFALEHDVPQRIG